MGGERDEVDCFSTKTFRISLSFFLPSIHSPQHACSAPSQTVGIYITPPHFESLQISRVRAKRLRKNACSSFLQNSIEAKSSSTVLKKLHQTPPSSTTKPTHPLFQPFKKNLEAYPFFDCRDSEISVDLDIYIIKSATLGLWLWL